MLVLEIYRITLLSNHVPCLNISILCFRDLQNYTTLKLEVNAGEVKYSFRDLQNYTTLKPQIKFEAQE